MNQHDHEHTPDPPPKDAADQQNKDRTAADQARTHGEHTQPVPADRLAAATGDGVHHVGYAGHAAAEEPAMKQPATASAAGGQTETRDGPSSHEGMGHGCRGQISLAYRPTRNQIAAVSLLSVLALTAALIFSASYANLRLSARDVGGAVMPPGMIMTYDSPGQSMKDMAAVDPRTVSFTASATARGDQPIEPRIENGVKVFDLDASVIKWNILPYEQVMAYAFNHQVPGPRIHVTEGDRVRINVTNHLPEPTTVHWHGLIVPNGMDGPANITQKPIEPGQTFTYEFTTQQAGTYFYHTHKEPDRQQALGLYGALIIDPKDPTVTPAHDLEYTIQLQEWLEREGYTYPAMLMEGALPNFFTINGKAYPSTDTIEMKVGQRLLVRFIGSNNNFVHPMHIHGGPFEVVARDGEIIQPSARFLADTVNVGPGQRYDVIWTARAPGKWLIHCHIPHHTTNDNVEEQGAGGLTMVIDVAP
jgi:FtsP/CotA-like multicopper oxidase with cupredoxin domain